MPFSKFLDPKNDIAFKRIFGNENHIDILIHFINDILELTGEESVQDVELLSTIMIPEIAYKKQSIVDVLCRDMHGTQFVVEMQVAPTKGFEKRAQYYAAKAYSRQLNQGKGADGKYANLKGVIFIAIADCVLFKNKKAYKSTHRITDTETYEHDLKDLSFTFIELPKFKKDKIESLTSITDKWLYFFKHAHETTEYDLKRIIGSDLVIERAYEALNQFNWTEAELLAYEEEKKRIMDNQAVLEYQLDEAEAKGIEKGVEKGIEKGIKEGVEKGKTEAITQTAIRMLQQNLPIKTVEVVTGLSADQLLRIKNNNKINR